MSDEELPDTFLEDKTYGYPRTFDPNFKGPVAKRSCTDVLCCIIFILFIIAYILLGLVAWVHGDPRRVAYPTDSKGHFCGQKGTPNENKTVLFYFNLFSCTSPSVVVNLQCPTTQICVSKCPEKFLTYMEIQFAYRTNKHYWTYYSQFCKSPFVKPAKTLAQVLLDDDCPTAIFPSKPFLQRCFPDFTTKNGTLTVGNKTTFEDGNGKTRNAIELRTAANRVNKILDARAIGMKVFEDYATTWYWILIGLTVAMLLSWMFVILLRFIAGVLFWVFMVGVIGIIGYGIWHCYQEHSNLQGRPNSHLTIYDIGIQTDISMYFQLKQTWFAFSEWILKTVFFKVIIMKENLCLKEILGWYNLLDTLITNVIKVNTSIILIATVNGEVIEGNLLYNLRK